MEENKIKELLDLVRSINVDEFIKNPTNDYLYESLIKEIEFLKNKVHQDHQKAEKIIEHITDVATGGFINDIDIQSEDSILDALSLSINVFNEELRGITISQLEYKDTLNALPNVVWVSDIEFNQVLYVNETIESIFGVSAVEMLANKDLWVKLIHPDDRKFVEDSFDSFFQTGIFEVKYRLIKPTGEIVWILDQAKFLFNCQGERYRIVGICKDITIQELTLQKVTDTTQKFELAQRIANIGNWDFDLNTQHVNWSNQLYAIFDIDPAIQGGKLYELYLSKIHPEDIEKLNTVIRQCILDGKSYDIKHRVIIGDAIKYIRGIGEPILIDGKIVGLSGTAQDISEVEEKSILVEHYNNYLKAVLNATEYSVVAADHTGIVSLFNKGAEQMTGYTAEEVINKQSPAIWHDLDEVVKHTQFINENYGLNIEPGFDTFIALARDLGITESFEFTYIRKDGKRIPVMLSVDTVKNESGEVIGFMGIAKDITKEKANELELKNQKESLEEAQSISKIGSWYWDLISGDLVWSKEHFSIFDIPENTPKEILYQVYRDKTHPDDLIVLDKLIQNSLSTGEHFEYIHRAIISPNSIKYVKGIGNAIKNDEGQIIAIQGTAQDITTEFKKQQVDKFVIEVSKSVLLKGDESIFYNNILNNLLSILDSEYGFIGEVFTDEITNMPFLRTYALTNIAWNEETKKFYEENVAKGLEFKNLNTLFGYCIKNKEIVISNSPSNDDRRGGLPHGHPSLNAFLGIPIMSGSTIVGMIGLANKHGGYSDYDVELISSFTTLFGSLIYSNKLDRNKEILLNENELIRAEFQNFFNLSTDFMAIVSEEGTFLQVNDVFEDKLGYTKEELINQPVMKIVHPDDLPMVAKDFEKVESDSTINQIETVLRYVSKTGEVFWISFKIVIDREHKKHYASGRDITLQRENDKALKEALNSVKEYKFALDQIAIVSTADLKGDIISVNEKFIEISGYSENELIGQNHRVVNSDMHDKLFFTDVWKTISSGETWRGEICNRKKTGELYWVDTLIVPYLDEKNKPLWYFSIRYDITDKKAQENLAVLNLELKKEKEIAEQKTKLKERFLANMSHEIRTPMNSILGLSNLMEKVGTLNPKQMDYIKTIKLNSKNLLNIINDILDLSKIEEGKLELEKTTIEIPALVKNIVKTLTLNAHKKKIDLISEIGNDVPEVVIGDSNRLNQVLLNLTNNALKFTDEGAVTISVTSKFKSERNVSLLFEIQDTGIGISEDRVDKIFEPFTQEKSSTTRLFGGTGLGLTISNQIIHAFGGQIKVKSVVGVGSVFYFELSFELPESQVKSLFIDESFNEELPEIKGKYSILLVEDNPFNQMVAEDTLKDWHGEFEIEIADNGLIAVDKLAQNKYDLVLMDIQMPEMDGHVATKKARTDLNISTPIIAMTAQATPSEIEACMHSGMNDYISKPFEEVRLKQVITKWLFMK
jgi:PAS domain S-box-containing protein